MRSRWSFHTLGSAAVTIVACAACASTNPNPNPGTTITTRVLSSPGSRVIETTDVTGADEVRVKGTPVDALSALAQIYGDLKIPIGTMIPEAGQIGNLHLTLPNHRLAGHTLSYYVDCGQESMVGSRSDLDDVTMSILSTTRRGADSVTAVGTQLTATARPSGTSSGPVDCQSTGALEKMIATRLMTALGSPADAKTD